MKTFTNEVLKNSNEKFLVKFGAPWCNPCKTVEPLLEEMSSEGFSVYDLNTDENPGLSKKYNIRGVPTFILFKDGEELKRTSGAMSKTQLIEFYN